MNAFRAHHNPVPCGDGYQISESWKGSEIRQGAELYRLRYKNPFEQWKAEKQKKNCLTRGLTDDNEPNNN